jgi:hypothetical protein
VIPVCGRFRGPSVVPYFSDAHDVVEFIEDGVNFLLGGLVDLEGLAGFGLFGLVGLEFGFFEGEALAGEVGVEPLEVGFGGGGAGLEGSAGIGEGGVDILEDEALDVGGGVVRAGVGNGGDRFLGGGEGLVGIHGKHFILGQKQGGKRAISQGRV